MFSCGWLWLYLGAFLMAAELAAPGFVIFFFGLSAATVGLLRFALGDSFSLIWQLAAFSFFSIVYLVLLRRWVKSVFSGDSTKSDFGNDSVGRIGKTTEAICPPKPGRILLGDAQWNAVADVPIAVGADVKVVSQENLTMKVEAI